MALLEPSTSSIYNQTRSHLNKSKLVTKKSWFAISKLHKKFIKISL